ncbi:hypothetical protein FN846DRAFT_507144 [Sphaerosporella brunnea]|uniref:Armadillo-type protein n=1 Tax=Sphaerosporella brunnea TaxID=1250544 RepID=A0A5J5F3E5_9PEZI|nr:hypothetical protein FN846DRAFT_507144 [Sphaerosporella brunnea]
MPIIQEISDDEDDNRSSKTSLSDEQKASAALDRCLHILNDESSSLESRYRQILEAIPPLEHYSTTTTTTTSLAAFESRLVQLLHPHPQLHPQQTFGFDDTEAPDSSSPALPLYHTLSSKLLSLLKNPAPTPSVAAALASLTSTADPWTTPHTAAQAQQLLASPALHDRTILLNGLLRDLLRPLFTQRTTSAARVTSSGRLALRETTDKRINTETPAWVVHLPSSVAILEWTIGALAPSDIEAAWGLLIPPVLTLLDSTMSSVKTRAVGMITLLLQRLEEDECTRSLLQRTGLAPVFWDAVLPCLSYLPPLTPASEAVPLLRAAYACLLALARVRERKDSKKKAKLLDALVREGFLRGLSFAGENVLVVLVLVEALATVVDEMGVWTVRHLQNVLPALTEILASPFGDTFPPLLLAATKTLQTLVRNCWVRFEAYVPELLRGVAVCWKRINQSESTEKPQLEQVEKELVNLVDMCRVVTVNVQGGKERWDCLRQGIVGVDQGFAMLFAREDSGL